MRARTALLTGAALGGGTLLARRGLAAIKAAESARLSQPERHAGVEFGELGHEVVSVPVSDGAVLHVEVGGLGDSDVTVVMAHGWTMTAATWHFQREALSAEARVVAYDQRGHGRSTAGESRKASLRRCARDLAAVIDAVAPTGTLVLAGHSMGAMTILALAGERPDLLRRVGGVLLIAASAGELASVQLVPGLLAPVAAKAFNGLLALVGRFPEQFGKLRKPDPLSLVIAAHLTVGPEASPSVSRLMERLIRQTPLDVTADCHFALAAHDEAASLPLFEGIPVHVMHGKWDVLMPVSHARRVADGIPGATLQVVDRVGHTVMLEAPDEVTDALRRLVHDAPAAGARHTGWGDVSTSTGDRKGQA